jgi:hypothetical protein
MKHQKKMIEQHDQQNFHLAMTTHMADVIFDHQIEFCEEYKTQLLKTIKTLIKEGPSKTCLTLSYELLEVRNKYCIWLTNNVAEILEKFEASIRKIGAQAQFYDHDPSGANDAGAAEEMFKVFQNIFGIASNDIKVDPDVAVSKIMKTLQNILGIEQLTNLRQNLISIAKERQNSCIR